MRMEEWIERDCSWYLAELELEVVLPLAVTSEVILTSTQLSAATTPVSGVPNAGQSDRLQ